MSVAEKVTLARRSVALAIVSVLATLPILSGCSPNEAATEDLAARASDPSKARPQRPVPCYVTLPGWQANATTLYGGCRLHGRAVVASSDLPALFKLWHIEGSPSDRDPLGSPNGNHLEYQITWLSSPSLHPKPPRWLPPTKIDCSQKLRGTNACLIKQLDDRIFKASVYLDSASWGNTRKDVVYYWDVAREAIYAVHEPRGLYVYAVFYEDDFLLELSAYSKAERWFPQLVDAARQRLPSWVNVARTGPSA